MTRCSTQAGVPRADRAVRARPRRAHLPDLGAHLRLQPGLRALPVSSSGRRDPRELSTAPVQGVIDELERMQVFYVNIGGGEPTVRPDFWELVDYATAHHVGVKFSTNGVPDHPGGRRAAGRQRLRRRADFSSTAPPPRSTTPSAAPGPTPLAVRAMDNLAAAGLRAAFKISRRRHPPQRRPARRVRRAGRVVTAPSCGSPGCAPRAAAPTSGTPCTPRPPSRCSSTTGCVANGDGVLTGDSFFHLGRSASAARGPEPVRRRPGGLPDRPGGRRLRLPVRHPRPRSWPAMCGRTAGSTASGDTPSCSPSCASRRAAGACAHLRVTTTPAGVGAWRPSSSPACRSTGPIPNA